MGNHSSREDPFCQELPYDRNSTTFYFQSPLAFHLRFTALVVVCLVGILANLVCVVVFSHKNMRGTIATGLLYAQSWIDILFLLSTMAVFSVSVYLQQYVHDPKRYLAALNAYYVFRYVFNPFLRAFYCTSILLVTIISFERFMAVCKPLLHQCYNTNVCVAKVCVLVAFLVSLGLNLPLLAMIRISINTYQERASGAIYSLKVQFVSGEFYHEISLYFLVMRLALFFLLPLSSCLLLGWLTQRRIAEAQAQRSVFQSGRKLSTKAIKQQDFTHAKIILQYAQVITLLIGF